MFTVKTLSKKTPIKSPGLADARQRWLPDVEERTLFGDNLPSVVKLASPPQVAYSALQKGCAPNSLT